MKKYTKVILSILIILLIIGWVTGPLQGILVAFYPKPKPKLKNFNKVYDDFETVTNFILNSEDIKVGDTIEYNFYEDKLINIDTNKNLKLTNELKDSLFHINDSFANAYLYYIYINKKTLSFSTNDFYNIVYSINDVAPQKLGTAFDEYLNFKVKKLRDNWYEIRGTAKAGYGRMIRARKLPGM